MKYLLAYIALFWVVCCGPDTPSLPKGTPAPTPTASPVEASTTVATPEPTPEPADVVEDDETLPDHCQFKVHRKGKHRSVEIYDSDGKKIKHVRLDKHND